MRFSTNLIDYNRILRLKHFILIAFISIHRLDYYISPSILLNYDTYLTRKIAIMIRETNIFDESRVAKDFDLEYLHGPLLPSSFFDKPSDLIEDPVTALHQVV